MLRYQKINVSEGIDVNKTSESKECELRHYWFSKDVGFKFEKHVCNGCHDLLTMAHSLKNIAILTAKENTFRCLLRGISKNEGFKRLNNSVTTYDEEYCKYSISPKIRQILLHWSYELTKKKIFLMS